MATTIDWANLGTLSPEDYAEQQALTKKQRLAQQLLSSSQNVPQGQMVSGHYVAPNFFQLLNPVAQAAAGKYLENQGDTEAYDYAKRLRARDQEEMKTGLELWRGTEKTPPNKQAAADFFMNASGKQAQALGQKLMEQEFKEPKWKETTLELPNGTKVQGQYNQEAPNPMSTFIPFATSGNVEVAKALHTGVQMPQIAGSGGTYQGVGAPQMGMMPQGAPQGGFVSQAQARGLPVISGFRTELQQAELRHHRDPVTGQWMTKENRPVSENSAHLHGNAIDLDPSKPISPADLAWLQQNAVQGKGKDSNHWEIKNPQAMPQAGMPQGNQPAIGAGDAYRQKYMLQESPIGFKSPEQKLAFYAEANKPLDGKAADKVSGGQDVIATVSQLMNAVKDWKKDDIYNPDKVAMMNGLVSNANMAIKDAKGLGVLNAPDLPQIEAMIANPTKWQTLLTNKDTFEKLYLNQIDSAQRTIHNQYINSRRQMPEETIQLMMGIDKDREARAAAKAKPAEGKATAPKATDVGAIKTWLGSKNLPYEPEKYVYGKDEKGYYRELRK